MSAYGSIAAPRSAGKLEIMAFDLPNGHTLTTHPVSEEETPRELVQYLFETFNIMLDGGQAWPYEERLSYEAFVSYFFTTASITVIGIVHSSRPASLPQTLQEAIAGRALIESVGGSFYIKPNYPGRSSHNCNGGFVVPEAMKGRKIGKALGSSYVAYAPRLGYRASVFNLVYKTNAASLAVWKSLGFEQVGLIPQAGRLKVGPKGEEEFVDAHVIYKSFV